LERRIRELLAGYLEKANNKLEVAKRLLVLHDYEDAVSRAYYAVFHTAQALLLTEGEKADTHRGVVTLFGLLFVKTGKFKRDLGKYLANLKDDRESGDYEIFSYIDGQTAETAIAEAEEFLREGKTYLKKMGFLD
jgi:uncharacterized protein (UPF0332 family)